MKDDKKRESNENLIDVLRERFNERKLEMMKKGFEEKNNKYYFNRHQPVNL